jgi:hypothetical protein
MHVKWEKQRLNSGPNGAAINLVATLVDSSPQAGRTQERCIEELGAIKEQFLKTRAKDTRAFHQGLFWVTVDKKLDRLRLDPGERERIEAKIFERVPRPNKDWALWGVTCIPRYDP